MNSITLDKFLEQYPVKLRLARLDERRDGMMTDMPPGSRHFGFTLSRKGKRYSGTFSQGPAIKEEPTVKDLLDSIAGDAAAAVGSFSDFCAEMGYDEDSRSAERIYKACERSRLGIHRLFGDTGAETLMFDTERL